MRRVTVLFAVLTLTSLISANQASAFGWRGQWRGSRYRNCDCRGAAAPTRHTQAPAQTVTPVTTATSKGTVQSDPSAKVDESALLVRLLDAMKGIVDLENERLDYELDLLEDHDYGYSSD